MFGRRRRQKYIDLSKAKRLEIGFFYHQYWRHDREFYGKDEKDSPYLPDDCARKWLEDEYGDCGLSIYTLIECLEEFLEYEKEHPNDYETIRSELNSRQPSQSLTGLSGELNEKKKELLERISSQREIIFRQRDEAHIEERKSYKPHNPSDGVGADFHVE